MMKRKLCEARFEWRLQCSGPLLISDRRYEPVKSPEERGKFPDKLFISHADPDTIHQAVKTRPAKDLGLTFYVPATSLRGPMRAQAERIVRSLLPEGTRPPANACDPFAAKGNALESCSKRLEAATVSVPYAALCPVCRLFGCTHSAGRIQVSDGSIEKGCTSAYRDMIGIDRFSGGIYTGGKGERSGGANLRLHVLENAAFTSTVTIVNFELWQLGLMAYVLRDFEQGLVPIGYGKTKGFGLVTGRVEKIWLTYQAGKASGLVHHLGSLAGEDEMRRYGLHSFEPPAIALSAEAPAGRNLYDIYSVPEDSRASFWEGAAQAFNRYMGDKETAA